MTEHEEKKLKPGVCISWEEKKKEFAEILGDEKLVQRIWEQVDLLAYLYVWAVLIQF